MHTPSISHGRLYRLVFHALCYVSSFCRLRAGGPPLFPPLGSFTGPPLHLHLSPLPDFLTEGARCGRSSLLLGPVPQPFSPSHSPVTLLSPLRLPTLALGMLISSPKRARAPSPGMESNMHSPFGKEGLSSLCPLPSPLRTQAHQVSCGLTFSRGALSAFSLPPGHGGWGRLWVLMGFNGHGHGCDF